MSHVRLRAGEGETRKADLGLYTVEGEVLGGVEGFTLRRASRAALLGAGVDELLYEVAWRAVPPVGVRPAAFLAGPEALGRSARPVGEVMSEVGSEGAELVAEEGALEEEPSPGLFVLTGGGALGRELSRELEEPEAAGGAGAGGCGPGGLAFVLRVAS